jgi:hypothetical protein
MDQVKFKGYAQQRGFQPIQAPMGVLSRMQEQSDRTLRGMRDNANALTAQRNQFEDATRSKLAREQQNRDDIYKFEQQSRRNYQQGKLNNLKLKAENVGEPDIQNLSALADLSKTVGNIVSDYAKQKKESDQLYGQNLVFQYGVTPKILSEYEAQKEQLTRGTAAANAAANQMEFRGVPTDVLDQIRGLGGWKLYGATRAYALQGAQDYSIFRGTSADTPIPFGDREITLSSASSTEEWEAANAFVRTEFLKSYNGINPALLNEHLYPKMRSLEMQERVSYQEARNKVLAENRKEEEAKDLLDSVSGVDPSSGFIDWIARYSGGDSAMRSAKKREAGAILENYASLGLLDRDTLDNIRAGSYLRADGQTRNIGEDFAVQFAKAYDAIYKREKRTVDEREFQESEAIKAFEKQVQDNIEAGVPLTAEALDSVLTQFENQFDREPTSFLKSLKTRTTDYVEEQALDAYFQDLDNRNLLTTRELNRYLATNPDLVAKYKSKASQNDQLANLPKDSVDNAKREINAKIKETLKQTGSDRVDSSAFIAASDMAERIFNEKVRYEMSVGNLSPQEAVDAAKQYLRNLIEDGKQGKGGPFAMKGQLDANGKFRPNLNQESPFEFQGRIPDNVKARNRARNVRESINDNVINIESDLFLQQDEVRSLERLARGQGGSFPSILAAVAAGRVDQNGNARTIVEIANAQLRAAGSDLQIGLSGADQIFKGLDPRWQIRLTNYPSTSNTFQAFSAAGNYKPILDLIASRESMGYGQYDAMNRGGSAGGTVAHGSANSVDVFGRGLSSMTVQEVMQLHADDKLHAAGRYQIIASTLRRLMDGGYGSTGVEPTDTFDSTTQDKLAIALMKGRAGRFLTGSGSLSAAVTGMGQEWIGLQNDKAKELLRTRLQQLRTTLQSPSPMRQPEMMRTNVAYRVGNIGPTSTGAHLHVGASDGGFFHRSFLDKYVRVGKTKGPLSQGVTVDGGGFGASRSYGSHKAWDFAFDDGTPVYLSNGAQVVGNRKTQHGDELVIQLPNGRQFYFLHGTAS